MSAEGPSWRALARTLLAEMPSHSRTPHDTPATFPEAAPRQAQLETSCFLFGY